MANEARRLVFRAIKDVDWETLALPAELGPTEVLVRTACTVISAGTEVAVYSGSDLAPGHRVAGPAMVEEMTTTVFVGADDQLEIDGANNFLIHLPAG